MNNYNAIRAAVANLQIKKGDTVVLNAALTDPNNADKPYDVTQFTSMRMQVKRSPKDADFLFEIDLNSGLEIVAPGTIKITLTPVQTNLVSGKYYYDIEGTPGPETLLTGTLFIKQDVTT